MKPHLLPYLELLNYVATLSLGALFVTRWTLIRFDPETPPRRRRLWLAFLFSLVSGYAILGTVNFGHHHLQMSMLGPAFAGLLAGPVTGLMTGGVVALATVLRWHGHMGILLSATPALFFAGFLPGMFHRWSGHQTPRALHAAIAGVIVATFDLVCMVFANGEPAWELIRVVGLLYFLAQVGGLALFSLGTRLLTRELDAMAGRTRMEKDLLIARSIQRDLLPSSLPAVPGLQLHAELEAASEVDGDSYDVFELAGNRLALVLADSAETGLPSALLMAQCRTLVRAEAWGVDEPGVLLARINTAIARDRVGQAALRLFCAVLDPVSGEFVWAAAGRPSVRRIVGNRRVVKLGPMKAPPLGEEPDAAYPTERSVLKPGEWLLCHTKGATGGDPDGETAMSEETITSVLYRNRLLSPAELCAAIKDAAREQRGGCPLKSDAILLCVRRAGNPFETTVRSTAPLP